VQGIAAATEPFLSQDQIHAFQRDGFLAIPAIATAAEVVRLRATLFRLFEEKAGFAEGAQYDLVGHDDGAPARLPQLLYPVNYAPELRDTPFRASALRLARQLLGPEARPAFEHAVLKPAGHGAVTPWHQDEAHRYDAAFDYEQVSIWMPLQDVDEANGCMKYMAGSHLGGVLQHGSPQADKSVYALEADAALFDESQARACPLPAGGCVVHHGRTLHSAGPNSTGEARLAYILAFELPPQPRTEPREFPWNAGRAPAAFARKREWRRRGGVLVEVLRRVRHRLRTNPVGLLYDARVAVRSLWR